MGTSRGSLRHRHTMLGRTGASTPQLGHTDSSNAPACCCCLLSSLLDSINNGGDGLGASGGDAVGDNFGDSTPPPPLTAAVAILP
jgi:hypothetical protein